MNAPHDVLLDDIFAEAKENYDHDRQAAAVELLEPYLRFRTHHAFAWFIYGDGQRILGRIGDARRSLRQAIALAPNHVGQIGMRLAMLYRDFGKKRLAEKWFAKVRKQNRNEACFWIERAKNLVLLGRIDLASRCYERAIRLGGPTLVEALFGSGTCLRAEGKYRAAEEMFRKAFATEPSDEAEAALASVASHWSRAARRTTAPHCVIAFARKSLRKNHALLATRLLRRALRIRGDDAHAWGLYGDALRRLGQIFKAKRALWRAIRAAPEDVAQVAPCLAILYKEQHDRRLAEKWFAIATDPICDPDNDFLLIMRGANLALRADLDGALICHDRAASLHGPTRGEALINRGLVLRALRDYDAAAAAFDASLALDPADLGAREARASLDRLTEARELIFRLS